MLVSAKVFDALKGIGLNLYERRLWVALLARGTGTASELSEIAGVPRSRTYDVLQSLADKGFVVVQTGKPIKYVAIPPDEALERAKKKLEEEYKIAIQRIDDLKESVVMRDLNDLFSKGLKIISPEDITGALKGKYSVHQQFETMFKDAKEKISILTTSDGLNELLKSHFDILKKAKEKGVQIRIATIADEKNADAIKSLSGIAEIRIINEKEIPISGRFTVVDGKELILSLTDSKVHSTQDMAIWSKSEYAAGQVLEPVFELIWKNSKSLA